MCEKERVFPYRSRMRLRAGCRCLAGIFTADRNCARPFSKNAEIRTILWVIQFGNDYFIGAGTRAVFRFYNVPRNKFEQCVCGSRDRGRNVWVCLMFAVWDRSVFFRYIINIYVKVIFIQYIVKLYLNNFPIFKHFSLDCFFYYLVYQNISS